MVASMIGPTLVAVALLAADVLSTHDAIAA
jgi:hypothetical protein